MEGIAESFASSDGAGDASHLPTEAEVRFRGAKSVAVHHHNRPQAQGEGNHHHPEK